jgi:hypothetical protein
LKNQPLAARNRLTWKWTRGTATIPMEFGNPVLGPTAYALCVYDESGGVSSLVISAAAPAAGTCSGKPCWKEVARGFRYKSAELTPGGLRTIALNAGTEGRASIIIKGKGDLLHMPVLPLHQDTKVTVQLVTSDRTVCWEAVYSAPVVTNTGARFKDSLP